MASLGQYELMNELGRGGMGRVVLARDRELGRLVALKFRKAGPSQDTLARNRFRREARSLAALNDPGIVQIFAIGCEEDTEYIAMEFVEGRTLRAAVRSGGLAGDKLLLCIADIADSMSSAHGAGILHRDLKPDNIMLAEGGQVKIVDFGLARRLDEVMAEDASISKAEVEAVFAETLPVEVGGSLTTESSVMGTPQYMAPELLHALEATPAADVYALGVCIYELIAGKPPISGKDVAEIIGRIIDRENRPTPLHQRSDVDRELSALVEEMMAWEPADRPSMGAVRDRLRELCRDRDAAAPAASRVGRVAGLLGIAAVVGALSIWQLAAMQDRMDRDAKITAPVPTSQQMLAIAPVSLRLDTAHVEDSNALADLFAVALRGGDLNVAGPGRLLDQIASASSSDPAWEAAAESVGATLLLRSVVERTPAGYQLAGEVRDLSGALRHEVAIQAGPGELDTLVVQLAQQIAEALQVSIGQVRPPAVEELDELEDYEFALEQMFAGRWTHAVKALEGTVAASPNFGAAWYRLALARSWGGLPAAEAAQAAKKAQALSHGARDQGLMHGLRLYLEGDYTGSLAILRPLQALHPGDRDVLYHLAEATYHNGMHTEGVALFKELLHDSPRFAMAAWHPFQRSLIDRDELGARRYRAILRPNKAVAKEDHDLAFAMGDYERLSLTSSVNNRVRSLAVLGDEAGLAAIFEGEASGALDMVEKIAWHHRAQEPERRDQVFDAYMQQLEEGDPEANNEFVQRQLGEVLITAGLPTHTERLLAAWKPGLRSSEVFRALKIHLAALRGDDLDPALYERNAGHTRAAAAARFEKRGKPAKAAALWRAAIADPHHYYMYMERAALLRNLSAQERKPVCAALAHPAIYRPALLVSECLPVVGPKASVALRR